MSLEFGNIISKPHEKSGVQTECIQVLIQSVINYVVEIKPNTVYSYGDSENFKI